MDLSREERLELFLERLGTAEPVATAAAALALLRQVLNEIEDEHSGTPYDPDNWRDDGRLYPPMDDRVKENPDRPGTLVGFSLGHVSYFGANGAIRVYDRKHRVVALDKAGADGRLYDE